MAKSKPPMVGPHIADIISKTNPELIEKLQYATTCDGDQLRTVGRWHVRPDVVKKYQEAGGIRLARRLKEIRWGHRREDGLCGFNTEDIAAAYIKLLA